MIDEAFARRVEEAGLNNLHTRRQLFYDGWLLFLSPGKAKRARSINPHFGSTLPLAQKIAHCEALYARHRLAPLFRITPFSQPAGLDAALAERGYTSFDTTLVQAASLRDAIPPRSADCTIDTPSPDAFVDAVGQMRGSPLAQRNAHLERLAQSPLALHAVVARRDGKAIAAGLLAVDGELAGIYDVVTVPACRGQGVASCIVARLLERAREEGARDAFLQVTEANAPAIALYRRFGFGTAYRYHYRAPPGHAE